jgi:2-keto-4-pentenoate hydratase/2-oxohepta-3-ene-1,7-dioic acid hydratase in catechol pathway
MRFATIIEDGQPGVALVRDEHLLPLHRAGLGFETMRAVAAGGEDGLGRIREWAERQPASAHLPLDTVQLGPAVPDPGAIYTVGLNYAAPDAIGVARPEPAQIKGKAAGTEAAHGGGLFGEGPLTANDLAEVGLGVGLSGQGGVGGDNNKNHIKKRGHRLDGVPRVLGKSMPGFGPVGPMIVTSDELDPAGLHLGATIDGVAIQDGSTDQMLYAIDEIIAYLRAHVHLAPGDLIATGTPTRLPGPLGPDRHLEPGDTVVAWIDGIGSLTTTVG